MNYPNLEKAIDVIAKLRDPKTGCPWDLNQTHTSLLKYLIEESYEYIQAVEENEPKAMEEELGDVLLQVLLHSKIASQSGLFDIDSVAKKLAEKMIYRHPHVFEDKSMVLNESEVLDNWKKLKEKKKPKPYHIMMEDIYAPALTASYNIGAKSQDINFDWDNISDVMAKVEEELQEVKDEIQTMESQKRIKEEIGDLLFSVSQLARHLDIDPEMALKDANAKFVKRINKVEDYVHNQGLKMTDLKTSELESIWQDIKKVK